MKNTIGMPLFKAIMSITVIIICFQNPSPAISMERSWPYQGRALSIRVLQERLRECRPTKSCSKELLHLADLKKIEGYVIDEKQHDLILIGKIGKTGSNFPSLFLEDFVVALRSAWMLYAVRKGSTLYYSDPGCSIDPDPRVMKHLQDIGHQINSSTSDSHIENQLKLWKRVCELPQRVQVLGIPPSTHFALLTVMADYDMKKLADGSEKLKLEDFKSLPELHIGKIDEAMKRKERISVAASTISRFWFYPKELKILEDDGVVFIDSFGVRLLTEEEHLNNQGEIVGKGEADTLAAEWAAAFTKSYKEISHERSIFSELQNIFWWVALSRTLRFKEAYRAAGLDPKELLYDFEVPDAKVESTLPGRSKISRKHYREELDGGYSELRLTLPSCGGVEMAVRVNKNSFELDTSGRLELIKRSVLFKRPSSSTLYWDF